MNLKRVLVFWHLLHNILHLSSCICWFHKYIAIWGRIRLLQRIDNTKNDPYNAVSVMKGREVVDHVPHKLPVAVLFLEMMDMLSVLL